MNAIFNGLSSFRMSAWMFNLSALTLMAGLGDAQEVPYPVSAPALGSIQIGQVPLINQGFPTQLGPLTTQTLPGQPAYPANPDPAQTLPSQQIPVVLQKSHLREIDGLVVQLSNYSKQLHDEYHHHFEGEWHAAKLDEDVTALERLADGLHAFAIQADGSPQSMARLRHDTNEFIQLSVRISRTIELTEPWLRTTNGLAGVQHLREVSRNAFATAMQIDRYLPVDTQVIDNQSERLEAAIKELHDEFHEHLEGYEVSNHLDEDLEEVETLVEHMHALAHDRSWQQIDFNHLLTDIGDVRHKVAHIESLFVQQAHIGVRTQDWIGIGHSRDAITDVLASAYLLEHMVRKTIPNLHPMHNSARPIYEDTRPMRDRHGHPIHGSSRLDLNHADPYFDRSYHIAPGR